MLFTNSCRCSVGGETFKLSSQSSRFRYPYSTPLFFWFLFFFFFFFFFCFSFSPWEVVSYVCMFLFFFATHHPPVITTCSWGSVGHFRPWTHTSDDSYIYQLSLLYLKTFLFNKMGSTLLTERKLAGRGNQISVLNRLSQITPTRYCITCDR